MPCAEFDVRLFLISALTVLRKLTALLACSLAAAAPFAAAFLECDEWSFENLVVTVCAALSALSADALAWFAVAWIAKRVSVVWLVCPLAVKLEAAASAALCLAHVRVCVTLWHLPLAALDSLASFFKAIALFLALDVSALQSALCCLTS